MDTQIKNSLKCQIKDCSNLAMGIGPTGKWTCGLCIIKFEKIFKEERKKYLEIMEKKI